VHEAAFWRFDRSDLHHSTTSSKASKAKADTTVRLGIHPSARSAARRAVSCSGCGPVRSNPFPLSTRATVSVAQLSRNNGDIVRRLRSRRIQSSAGSSAPRTPEAGSPTRSVGSQVDPRISAVYSLCVPGYIFSPAQPIWVKTGTSCPDEVRAAQAQLVRRHQEKSSVSCSKSKPSELPWARPSHHRLVSTPDLWEL
jgi:hypothetical protein